MVHILDRPLDVDEVDGSVDWDRRFDLMQQHTGQHILSAAFLERLEAATVGFHLSGEYSTIDLDRAPLSGHDLTSGGRAGECRCFRKPAGRGALGA